MNAHPRSPFKLVWMACLLLIFQAAGWLQSCDGPEIDIQFTLEGLSDQVLVDQDPTDNEPASRIQDVELHLDENPNKTLVGGGTIIDTDSSGEGLLEGIGEENTCRVYVYRDTQLSKRACPRAAYEGSSYVCVEEGSASFQNCSSYLVMTPTGEAQLQGTWMLVSYLPAERVSVFTVTEGRARVFPVTDGPSGKLGEPVVVRAGQFLYTAPDNALRAIDGLPPRTAHSQERLPLLLQYYDLGRWLDQAVLRAAEAAAPLPELSTLYGPPDLVVKVELGELPPNFSQPTAAAPSIYVPLRITVANRGGETAGPFKISVFGSAGDGDFLRAFLPYDGESDFYIFFNEKLLPGSEVEFLGAIGFSTSLKGEAKIYAEVDSCAGEEFAPEGCRVQESDERNNFSDGMIVNLERYR